MSEADVDAVLDSCGRSTVTGRRDRAILVLLARLGLRSGEVAALRLSDVDWRAGEGSRIPTESEMVETWEVAAALPAAPSPGSENKASSRPSPKRGTYVR